MINYCSKFINNVTEDTVYLYGLIKKNSEFNWEEAGSDRKLTEAISRVKKKLGTVKTKAISRHEEKFILVTDASDVGISAILSQEQEGKERVSVISPRHTHQQKETMQRQKRNY